MGIGGNTYQSLAFECPVNTNPTGYGARSTVFGLTDIKVGLGSNSDSKQDHYPAL